MTQPSSPSQKKRRYLIEVFGKSGSGKTRWILDRLRLIHRAIIIDPVGDEYPGEEYDDPLDLINSLEGKRIFRVKTSNLQAFPALCLAARSIPGTTLIVDEAQRIFPPMTPLPPEFEDVLYRGRHTRTSLILAAQRPSTVHIAARSQWTRIIAFWQTEPADRRWLEATTGNDLPDLDRLTEGEHYHITPGGCEKIAGTGRPIGGLDISEKSL